MLACVLLAAQRVRRPPIVASSCCGMFGTTSGSSDIWPGRGLTPLFSDDPFGFLAGQGGLSLPVLAFLRRIQTSWVTFTGRGRQRFNESPPPSLPDPVSRLDALD